MKKLFQNKLYGSLLLSKRRTSEYSRTKAKKYTARLCVCGYLYDPNVGVDARVRHKLFLMLTDF